VLASVVQGDADTCNTTAFSARVTLAQSHMRSGLFGAKILKYYRTPKC